MTSRLIAIAGLVSLAVAAVLLVQVWADRGFDAKDFRNAAAAGDSTEIRREGRAAVQSRALIGMTVTELRSTLGAPERRGPRRRLWIWGAGHTSNDYGSGEVQSLYVQFDRDGRVGRAEVSQYFGESSTTYD